MKRLLWKAAYPFVIAANKMGVSYKWVNVSRSAWGGFDPLWQHRWFGDAVESMPPKVNLCGIMYRVSVAEGLVSFRCDDGMSTAAIMYARDPHDQYGFLWYLTLDGMPCAACHVEQSYKWVKAVYGGSHDIKKKALTVYDEASK